MTEKITMIELFSGIGAQERALRQLNIPYEITHTCDLDKDAVLSYAAMRSDLENDFISYDFPSVEDMISELQSKNVGYDFILSKKREKTDGYLHHLNLSLQGNNILNSEYETMPYKAMPGRNFLVSLKWKSEKICNRLCKSYSSRKERLYRNASPWCIYCRIRGQLCNYGSS